MVDLCAPRFLSSLASLTSQSLTALSPPPEASSEPSGLKTTDWTPPLWAFLNSLTVLPSLGFQKRMASSRLPVATMVPSLLKATQLTGLLGVGPFRTWRSLPVGKSQI